MLIGETQTSEPARIAGLSWRRRYNASRVNRAARFVRTENA
jgi:hypothetical protein